MAESVLQALLINMLATVIVYGLLGYFNKE